MTGRTGTFITTLFLLAKHYWYRNRYDEMIRGRIVVDIRKHALSEKFQLDAELNLDKAITQVCQSETVKLQQPLLHGTQWRIQIS